MADRDDPESERTPLESPYSLKQVMLKLGSIELHAAAAANNSLRTASRVDRLADAFEALADRVTALELSQRWIPLLFSAAALAVSLWVAFQVRR